MLHPHPGFPAVGIDPVKPGGDAVEILYCLAHVPEGIKGDLDLLIPCLFHHFEHIGQDVVHLFPVGHGIDFAPEGAGGHSQGRDKGVFLHILGAEGLVEIVHDCHNGFFHRSVSFLIAAHRRTVIR